MNVLYLVRHAKAGDRSQWGGDDRLRPLSKRGRSQSALLAERLRDRGVTKLLSSPFVRCSETLAPLGELIGQPVEPIDELAEYSDPAAVVELLRTIPDGTVLCSHGDMIPGTIEILRHHGLEVTNEDDWRKAATWVLKRNRKGKIVRATTWPPPRP